MKWLGKLLFPDIYKQMEQLMATLQDVIDAAIAEKAEVDAKLAEQAAKIQALEEQLANGEVVTPAQLEEVRTAIQNIINPTV